MRLARPGPARAEAAAPVAPVAPTATARPGGVAGGGGVRNDTAPAGPSP